MKQLYKADGKVYMFVEYSNDFHEGCTKCDLLHSDAKTCSNAPCGGGYFIENKEEKIMNNTKKPHIHAEVIKAWADGATIEFVNNNGEWEETGPNPWWETINRYRVKPEPTYPETTLSNESLENIYGEYNGDQKESLHFLANQVIKEFIVSGQMDEYIKERNN